MSERPEQYGNEPESVGIEKSLVGLQQSVDRLANVVRRTHGIETPKQTTLSAEERLHCLKDIRWALQHIEAHAVDPANYTQFHHEVILQAIQSVRPSLQALFEDASRAE